MMKKKLIIIFIGELWWTVATIEEDGTLNQRGRVASNSYGVRPAMWINY